MRYQYPSLPTEKMFLQRNQKDFIYQYLTETNIQNHYLQTITPPYLCYLIRITDRNRLEEATKEQD